LVNGLQFTVQFTGLQIEQRTKNKQQTTKSEEQRAKSKEQRT